MTIGEEFKIAREEKNITLKEIQENIKIRTRYLEAIEDNNFDIIPGEAYVKAFIKSYANFVGLDYNDLFEQYEEIKAEEKRKEEQLREDNEKNNRDGDNLLHNKVLISSIIIIVLVAILVFLIYNVFLLNSSKNDIDMDSNNGSIQVLTDNIQNEDNFYESNSLLNKNSNDFNIIENTETGDGLLDDNDNLTIKEENVEEEVNGGEKKIDLIVVDRSWIQIFADGKEVYEGILDKGNSKSYIYSENIFMKIGNGSGIKVRKGNRVLGPWGKKGEVIQKTIE